MWTLPASPRGSSSVTAPRLLDCLCGVIGSRRSEEFLRGLSDAEWREIAQRAARHGLQPLLYSGLAAFPPGAIQVPAELLQSLREAFLMSGTKNQLLYLDLARVLSALQQDGVGVIVLKGAHLAELVYGNIALRPMGDIDLLVGRSDLAKTAARLRDLGYAADMSGLEIEDLVRGVSGKHLPSFFQPPHPRIEAHWSLSPGAGAENIGQLWKTARPATLAGVPARVLSPECLVLHLCLHMRLHCLEMGLKPLCDLAATLRRYRDELDWKEVLSLAGAWHEEKSVYVALALTADLLGEAAPREVLQSLRPPDFDQRWLDQARALALEPEPDAAPRLYTLLEDWGSAPLSGKARYLMRTAFPTREHMACYMLQHHSLPLTPCRKYTCYLTRALDVGGNALRMAGRLAARGLFHRAETAAHLARMRERALFGKWLNEHAAYNTEKP